LLADKFATLSNRLQWYKRESQILVVISEKYFYYLGRPFTQATGICKRENLGGKKWRLFCHHFRFFYVLTVCNRKLVGAVSNHATWHFYCVLSWWAAAVCRGANVISLFFMYENLTNPNPLGAVSAV